MPTSIPLWLIVIVVLIALAIFWLIGVAHEIQHGRARELFRLQMDRLLQRFLASAASTSVPRGLIWLSVDLAGDLLLAQDRRTKQLVAFVPVTIRFRADPDGDMVDLPAVDLPRHATALFTFERGEWQTVGKVVFNHTPEQALEQFADQYRLLHD